MLAHTCSRAGPPYPAGGQKAPNSPRTAASAVSALVPDLADSIPRLAPARGPGGAKAAWEASPSLRPPIGEVRKNRMNLLSHLEDFVQDPAGRGHVFRPNRQVVFPGGGNIRVPCELLDDLDRKPLRPVRDRRSPQPGLGLRPRPEPKECRGLSLVRPPLLRVTRTCQACHRHGVCVRTGLCTVHDAGLTVAARLSLFLLTLRRRGWHRREPVVAAFPFGPEAGVGQRERLA